MADAESQPVSESQVPTPVKPGTFSLLRESRSFRLLWLSGVFFFTGTWVQGLVMAWLAYEITKSPFLLSIFSAMRMFPMFLGPIGGVIAQRFDRMGTLMWTQVFGI